jgi:hypothetical protein
LGRQTGYLLQSLQANAKGCLFAKDFRYYPCRIFRWNKKAATPKHARSYTNSIMTVASQEQLENVNWNQFCSLHFQLQNLGSN